MLGLSLLILITYSQTWLTLFFGETVDQSSSSLVRDVYFPAYGAAAIMLAFNLNHSFRAMPRQPFLILILMIVGLSSLWSVAPDQTARRIVAIVFTTLGGFVIGARYRWRQMAEVLAICFALLAIGSFIAGAFAPSIGRMQSVFPGAWRGLWSEKNGLGDDMTMGFVVLAAAAIFEPRRRWLWSGCALLAVLLVILSQSKTSLVALMLGTVAIGFVALVRRGPIMGVITSFGAVVGVFGALAVALFAADVVFALLGKDATLTGRTKIWEGVMHEIRLRPWQGYGYGAVWDDKTGWGPVYWITKIAGFRAGHAHNSWLEQWLGLGLFGLAAWVLYFTQSAILAIVAVYRDRSAFLALPFILVYGMVSVTESIAVVYNDFRWVIFVIVAVKLAYPDEAMDR